MDRTKNRGVLPPLLQCTVRTDSLSPFAISIAIAVVIYYRRRSDSVVSTMGSFGELSGRDFEARCEDVSDKYQVISWIYPNPPPFAYTSNRE